MASSASISSVDFSTTPTSNSSDAADNGLLWDVQDILAERTSIDSRKQNELFIVWKACCGCKRKESRERRRRETGTTCSTVKMRGYKSAPQARTKRQ